MFEPDLFFLYTNDSCLLCQHTMSKKLVENRNKKYDKDEFVDNKLSEN